VTPGKGGTSVEGIPVFNTVREAREKTGANASVIFVPPAFAADAILESADAGMPLVVAITEEFHHRHDSCCSVLARQDDATYRTQLPGYHLSGKCKIGIMPGRIHKQGNVGVVSRSGTLTYEAGGQLTALVLDNPPALASAATPSSERISWMRFASLTRIPTPTVSS